MAAIDEILKQIDSALQMWELHRTQSRYDDLSDLPDRALLTEIKTVVSATIDRLAPPNSPYRQTMNEVLANRIGALRALRRDYAAGYLRSVRNLVRAELFADFLEMAQHLLATGYKDPAAVVVGSVLEEHLRNLCETHGISCQVGGRPKKSESMNTELAAAGVYNKLDQKNVTAWLDLRNKAAHGHCDEYTLEQVGNMLSAVQEFMARVGA